MLQKFRARDASFLGYMTDQKNRRIGFFGELLELGSAFPDLGNTAGRGIDKGRSEGLNAVDDDQAGLQLFDLGEDDLR
jgi:hypothetical protein